MLNINKIRSAQKESPSEIATAKQVLAALMERLRRVEAEKGIDSPEYVAGASEIYHTARNIETAEEATGPNDRGDTSYEARQTAH